MPACAGGAESAASRAMIPRILLCVLGLILAGRATAATASAARPNIVFILLDNLGQEWFDCYGSEERCTPQIDRLAATGVRFTNCYTTTVCGPSRVQLLIYGSLHAHWP